MFCELGFFASSEDSLVSHLRKKRGMMMPAFILPWGSTHGILPNCEIYFERWHEKFIVFSGIQSNVSHGEKFSPCLGRIMIMSVCELGFFVRLSQGKTVLYLIFVNNNNDDATFQFTLGLHLRNSPLL